MTYAVFVLDLGSLCSFTCAVLTDCRSSELEVAHQLQGDRSESYAYFQHHFWKQNWIRAFAHELPSLRPELSDHLFLVPT